MHIAQVIFIVSFFLSFSPASARLSHRAHGGLNAVLKRKRVASAVGNRTVLGGDDQNELRKRDGTKYVFMHHVRRSRNDNTRRCLTFFLGFHRLSEVRPCSSPPFGHADLFLFSLFLVIFPPITDTYVFLTSRRFPGSHFLCLSTVTHTPKQTGRMTSNESRPRGCAYAYPHFLTSEPDVSTHLHV